MAVCVPLRNPRLHRQYNVGGKRWVYYYVANHDTFSLSLESKIVVRGLVKLIVNSLVTFSVKGSNPRCHESPCNNGTPLTTDRLEDRGLYFRKVAKGYCLQNCSNLKKHVIIVNSRCNSYHRRASLLFYSLRYRFIRCVH